jgi:arabinogalactan endo-1,4-beta-galactosidase
MIGTIRQSKWSCAARVGFIAAAATSLLAASVSAKPADAAGSSLPAVAAAPHPALPPILTGGDVSLLALEDQKGQVYKDGGRPGDVLAMFKARGCNCMRLRLWVHPSGRDIYVNDLPYTVALGRRIKRSGLLLLLDIHYSDTWADPGKQAKPTAWAALPFDQLVTTVHDYSRDVVAAMAAGGAMPDIVQVGNEISGGMLFPDGKNWGPGNDFVHLGSLLKAGIAGVKEGAGGQPQPWIMVHIDKGGDWQGTRWFFDGIGAQGVQFDIIGESYYPYFQGPLAGLKTTLMNAAARYHKPILIAETGYAYRDDGRDPRPGVVYAKTPAGQAQFLTDLMDVVRGTPGCIGAIYWAPEWIPVKGLDGSWNGNTLFDDAGNALPGLEALRPTPRSATP